MMNRCPAHVLACFKAQLLDPLFSARLGGQVLALSVQSSLSFRVHALGP